MNTVTIPIEKKAQRIGKTTVSGGGNAVVPIGDTVAARDYTAAKGYSGIVDWDGERVIVGGNPITPKLVKNGVAYVNQNELDGVISDFEKRNGIVDYSVIADRYDKKYGRAIDTLLDDLNNREGFSYKPDDDPVYKAYKEQYERLANDAYRKTLNDNNTSAAGASGAVLAEAMANRDGYLKELTDIIPELAREAYERYSSENENMRDNLESLTEIANSYYDRMYTASEDSAENAVKAGESEREEKQRWTENELNEEKMRGENARNEKKDAYEFAQITAELEKAAAELLYYPQEMDLKLENARLENEDNALENAASRGFFTAADEKSLPWLKSFRTYNGYGIDPHTAIAALEYDKAYSKQKATQTAKMGL